MEDTLNSPTVVKIEYLHINDIYSHIGYAREDACFFTGADTEEYMCSILQGCGTFAIEAVFNTTVDREKDKVRLKS